MQKVRIQFAYKAGFRRAWAVVSVLWILFSLNISIFRMANEPAFETFMGAFLPPLFLYFVGAATVWIIAGFAKAD